MDDVVYGCTDLSESDISFLRRIRSEMHLLADISRADVLMYCQGEATKALVIAQARPHSVSPIYTETLIGRVVAPADEPLVFRVLVHGRYSRGAHMVIAHGAPVVQEAHPIRNTDGEVIGVLSIETNLPEHERHRSRSHVFQRALRQLQEMALRGGLIGVDHLSSFGEHDGIIVVDAQKRIQYMSGNATNLYRKLGYMERLLKRRLSTLDTADENFVSLVLREGRCIEKEVQEGNRTWIRKVIPLISWEGRLDRLRKFLPLSPPEPCLVGVILTIHDATEARRKERELKIKSAMIQEIHHRVKNNLQTIAAFLRLQTRRTDSGEVRRILQESINRVLSIAVVHEFLSEYESQPINIKDISQRIIKQLVQGMLDSEGRIQLNLKGVDIYLPAQQATACALVINELLQNALEHGYDRRTEGTISITLQDEDQRIAIEVNDDGRGLPVGFALAHNSSLGLRIVQTLVQDDLKGHFELRSGDGVSAIVTFPKPEVREETLKLLN